MEEYSDPTSCPGTVWRPAVLASVRQASEQVEAAEDAVDVQWFRAIPDTGYDGQAGRIDAGNSQGVFRYEPQDGIYRVIVQSLSAMLRRFYPQGDWESGECTLAFDPNTFPLSIFDRIVLQPPRSEEASLYPKGLVYTQKERMVRGADTAPAAGTVSAAGPILTGIGTQFTQDFLPGGCIHFSGQSALILSIEDDTHLTLSAPSLLPVFGSAIAKGIDLPLYAPIGSLIHVRSSSGDIYVPGVDVAVSADRNTLEWLSPLFCPLPGQTYSLIYTYHPTYQVSDMGTKLISPGGQAGLVTTTARLLKPERLTR